MEEKEYCEECRKEITKEMKESQQVIYASAEHTLDGEDFSFCDPMFGGAYCCFNCFAEQCGINNAKKQATSTCRDEILKIVDELKEHTKHSFCDSSRHCDCDICHYQKLILEELKSRIKEKFG